MRTSQTSHGFRVLYTASNVTSFIVVVPGVGSLSPENWGKSSGEPWLKILLLNAAPNSRIICFNHGLSSEDNFSWRGLVESGTDLVDALLKLRQDETVQEYPLLFVCHSLGGIVLKQALCLAHQDLDRFRGLLGVTAGLILMGSPHSNTDSEEAWRNISLIPKASLKNFSNRPLTPDERAILTGLSRQFETIASPISILSIYESRETRLRGAMFSVKSLVLVKREFALTNSRHEEEFRIEADHNKLCDIGSKSEAYQTISAFIREAIEAAQRDQFLDTVSSRGSIFSDIVNYNDEVPTHRSEGVSPHSSGASPPAPLPRDDGEMARRERVKASRSAAFNMISEVSNFSHREPQLPCYLHKTHTRNPTFFGRQDILNKMAEVLLPSISQVSGTERTQLRTFGLCGMGGVGKTETAVEFMFSYKEDFDAVFWVQADEPAKIADGFCQIAVELGLEDVGTLQNQAVSRDIVKSWLRRPLKRYHLDVVSPPQYASWLLILDNVDDESILKDYWPSEGIGSILVTSRDPLAKTRTYGVSGGFRLESFDEKTAAQFLMELRCTDEDEEAEEEHAEGSISDEAIAVARRLGGHPLALTQMAGLINREFLSYEEFLARYDEQNMRELHSLQIGIQETGYEHSFSSVWALDHLERPASLLLNIIALLDPDRIPEEILTIGASQLEINGFPKGPREYQKSRGELLKCSLITRNIKQNEIRVHRLTQDGVRAAMSDEQLHKTFDAAVTLISAAWPFITIDQRHNIQRWKQCESYFPHVLRLKNYYSEYILPRGLFKCGLSFARLLNDVGWYFYERSIPENCEPFFQLAQLVCESQDEDAVDLLSDIHYSRGADASEVNDPERCMKHTSYFFQLRLDHSQTSPQKRRDMRLAVGYNQMGVAYMMKKDYESAVGVLEKAFEVYASLDNSTPILATLPAANMGLAYWFLRRYDEAYRVLINMLREREKVFGVNDKDSFKTGRILHALGNVTGSQGRLKDSFDFHQRALVQYRSTIGDNHHRTADVCYKVAEHYIRFGRLEDARKLLDQALQVFSSRVYYKHEKARTDYLMGRLLAMIGEEQKSRDHLQDASAAYHSLRPGDDRPAEELSDADFDDLVCFWSR